MLPRGILKVFFGQPFSARFKFNRMNGFYKLLYSHISEFLSRYTDNSNLQNWASVGEVRYRVSYIR
jgi:hypothetical protein